MLRKTTIFRSNQLGCVPAEGCAFPAGVSEVVVLRDGPRRILVPVNRVWDDFFDSPGAALPERRETN